MFVQTLVFLSAAVMYRSAATANIRLPECVEENDDVVRARILARHVTLNTEYKHRIVEIWTMVRTLPLKHHALMNTRRLEAEWATTPYRLDTDAIITLYTAVLSPVGAPTWFFIGRVFLANQLIPLENPVQISQHTRPLNLHVLYVY